MTQPEGEVSARAKSAEKKALKETSAIPTATCRMTELRFRMRSAGVLKALGNTIDTRQQGFE
jgi:hypothetical protein